jgi:hypothetical protein
MGRKSLLLIMRKNAPKRVVAARIMIKIFMRVWLVALVLALAGLVVAADTARLSPPLQIQRLHGPSITLAQYRGKVVGLAFILTTCSHCQDLTRVLNRLAPVYAPRGVRFIECAFNGDAQATMQEFLDRFQPPFPVGWTTDAAVRSYLRIPIVDPHPLYAPYMVFLDRRGVIRAEAQGDFFRNAEENVRAELDKLLKPNEVRR